MFPDSTPAAATEQAVTIHQPVPLAPVQPYAAPLPPLQPDTAATVTSVVLPDGRVVTGYTLTPTPAPLPEQTRPVVSAPRSTSRWAVSASPPCAAGWCC